MLLKSLYIVSSSSGLYVSRVFGTQVFMVAKFSSLHVCSFFLIPRSLSKPLSQPLSYSGHQKFPRDLWVLIRIFSWPKAFIGCVQESCPEWANRNQMFINEPEKLINAFLKRYWDHMSQSPCSGATCDIIESQVGPSYNLVVLSGCCWNVNCQNKSVGGRPLPLHLSGFTKRETPLRQLPKGFHLCMMSSPQLHSRLVHIAGFPGNPYPPCWKIPYAC